MTSRGVLPVASDDVVIGGRQLDDNLRFDLWWFLCGSLSFLHTQFL